MTTPMPTPNLDDVSRAIQATRESLAAAGYAIDVAEDANRLVFNVKAVDGACEECLVPKAVFVDILGRELAEAGVPAASFDVVYPLDDD